LAGLSVQQLPLLFALAFRVCLSDDFALQRRPSQCLCPLQVRAQLATGPESLHEARAETGLQRQVQSVLQNLPDYLPSFLVCHSVHQAWPRHSSGRTAVPAGDLLRCPDQYICRLWKGMAPFPSAVCVCYSGGWSSVERNWALIVVAISLSTR